MPPKKHTTKMPEFEVRVIEAKNIDKYLSEIKELFFQVKEEMDFGKWTAPDISDEEARKGIAEYVEDFPKRKWRESVTGKFLLVFDENEKIVGFADLAENLYGRWRNEKGELDYLAWVKKTGSKELLEKLDEVNKKKGVAVTLRFPYIRFVSPGSIDLMPIFDTFSLKKI